MYNLSLLANVRTHINCYNVCYIQKIRQVSHFEAEYFIFMNGCLYTLCGSEFQFVLDFKKFVNFPVVAGMQYDEAFDSLVIALRSGEIYEVTNFSGSTPEVAKLLTFNGIQAISWSHDYDSVVVVSQEEVHVLTGTFEIMSSASMYNKCSGKAAREVLTPREPIEIEECNCYISWQSESELFAISFYNHILRKRQIKIYKKSGNLQCYGEDLSGLEGPIAWKSTGSYLAFCQRLPIGYFIGFFEKNGLKHESFEIGSHFKVEQILWNCNATVLTLQLLHTNTNKYCIQMWTRANYQWDLKQEIPCDHSVRFLSWDDINPQRLVLALSNGELHVSYWVSLIDSEKCWLRKDSSARLAVISGDQVNLTNFKEAVVPPPLYQYTVQCPCVVSSVIFPSWHYSFDDEMNSMFAALMNNNQMAIYKINGEPKLLSILSIQNECLIDKIVWINPTEFAILSSLNASTSQLFILKVIDNHLKISSVQSILLHSYVITMDFLNGVLVLQLSSGKVIEVEISSVNPLNDDELENFSGHVQSPSIRRDHKFILPEICGRVDVTSFGYFSLSFTNRLYCNGKELSMSVTSFLIHKPYLLATSSASNQTLQIFSIIGEKAIPLSHRAIERGSHLALAFDNSVILQLPRGNFEVIFPRTLVISSAKSLIDNLHYAEVVMLFRKLRIHMNLIVDHNLDKFLANTDLFVNTVLPEYITLFIAELKEEDVTKTNYGAYYKEIRPDQPLEKVTEVCRGLVNAMNTDKKNDFMVPMISALVKMDCLNEAFDLVTNDKLFNHLLLLMDIDTLYERALSVYNWDFALKIAQKSQMDPKIYIPYLNSLKMMEHNFAKFNIDCSLHRPQAALKHLSTCYLDEDKLNLCVQHVVKYGLYDDALLIFKNDQEKYNLFCDLYGEFLIKRGLHVQAGIIFKRVSLWNKAMAAFAKAGDWRECALLTPYLTDRDMSVETALEGVIVHLKSSSKYKDAGQLYFEILDDNLNAIQMFVQGKHWQDALYVSRQNNNLSRDLINAAVIEFAEVLVHDIETSKVGYAGMLARFEEIRRLEDSGAPQNLADAWEDSSDSCSVLSVKSGPSSTSSQRTKKAKRKVWNLKKGNPREKISLMHEMKEVIKNSSNLLLENVHGTCNALMELEEDVKAKELQFSYNIYVHFLNKSKSSIWGIDPNVADHSFLDKEVSLPPKDVSPRWKVPFL